MSTDSQIYLDVVGRAERDWPPAYDGCITRPCPRCGAEPYERCTNPLRSATRHASKMPCLLRLVDIN
jgi:hypothetical protein